VEQDVVIVAIDEAAVRASRIHLGDCRVKRKVALVGIAVMTCLALFLGYWLCFAFWMTAYYTEPVLLKTWQTRFYVLLAGLVLAGIGDLYLVIRTIRSR
jgi:hypothetical protein